jgi:hypothetical protein
MSFYIKFAAVAHLADGQFLSARENREKFIISREGVLKLVIETRKKC